MRHAKVQLIYNLTYSGDSNTRISLVGYYCAVAPQFSTQIKRAIDLLRVSSIFKLKGMDTRNSKRLFSTSMKSDQITCVINQEAEIPGSPFCFNPVSPCNNGFPTPWMSPVVTPLADVRSCGCIANVVKQIGHVYSLAISSADGLLYTGSDSPNICVWRQPISYEHGFLRSGSGSVKAIVTVGDKIFSAHSDNKIRVWRKGKRIGTLPTVTDQLQNSVNPRNFVPVRRHHRSLWIKHVDVISSLAVNEEQGVLYSGSWDKTVKVWRMSDWKCVESIQAHHDAVNCLAVRPGGLVITGSADCTVRVWKRLNEKHVLAQTLVLQQCAVNGVAMSPDGGILYAGSADGIVNYWEKDKLSRSMRHAGLLKGHGLAVLCVATVSSLVLSGSADKTIRVWRRDAGTLHTSLIVLHGHGGPVKSIAATVDDFSDFAFVYSGSLDRSVKVWRIQTDTVKHLVVSPAWVQQNLGY